MLNFADYMAIRHFTILINITPKNPLSSKYGLGEARSNNIVTS